ncbi:MAG: DUF2809 domain-containing protein [Phycisphaerales bacterium]|nr:DUF2809 domain-containing protein [Phycisphaerales bacterium]
MSVPASSTRIRMFAILGMVVAAAVGLVSRTEPFRGIPAVGTWTGDTCWAVAAYFLVRFVLPRARIRTVALVAAGICLAVETSQLIHAEWLENLRSHRIVALLIGRGFLWIDLVRYALGLVIAMGLDRVLGPGPRAAPGRSRSTPKR